MPRAGYGCLLAGLMLPAVSIAASDHGYGMLWSQRLQEASDRHEQRSQPTLDPVHRRIIVGTAKGELQARNIDDGSLAWKQGFAGRVSGQAVVSGPAVLVTADDGMLHALRVDNGERVWVFALGTEPSAPPVVSRSRVYLQTGLDQLVVLDLQDGSLLWTCDRYEDGGRPEQVTLYGHTRPTPVLLPLSQRGKAKRLVLMGTSDGQLLAINDEPEEGECEVVWAKRLGPEGRDFSDVDAGPVVLDGIIYTASYAGGVYALSLADGAVQWHRKRLRGVHGIAGDRSRLYLTARDRVAAIDRKTGKNLWRYRFSGGVPTAPTVRDGVLWFGRSTGPMTRLNAVTGDVLQVIDTGTGFTAGPALRKQLAVLFSNGGILYLLAKNQGDALQ